jgi:hypothetical protein
MSLGVDGHMRTPVMINATPGASKNMATAMPGHPA